jgi:hypothetical protein
MRDVRCAVAAATAFVVLTHAAARRTVADDDRACADVHAIRTVATVSFPLLLLSLVPPEDRSDLRLVVPIAWNVLLWSVDTALSAAGDGAAGASAVRLDASHLSSVAFGLTHLVGSKPDGPYHCMFVYAVVAFLLVVSPSHKLDATDGTAVRINAVQKGVLTWCTGLIAAASTMAFCRA